jgi:hypothetical protein
VSIAVHHGPPTPGRYLQIPVDGKLGYLVGKHRGQVERLPVPSLVAWNDTVGAVSIVSTADGSETVRLTLEASDVADVVRLPNKLTWLAMPLALAQEYLLPVDRGPVARTIRDRNAEFKAVEVTQSLAWRLWWDRDLVIGANPITTFVVHRTSRDAEVTAYSITLYVAGVAVGKTTLAPWTAEAPATHPTIGGGSTHTPDEVMAKIASFVLDGFEYYDQRAVQQMLADAGAPDDVPPGMYGPLALGKAVGTWREPDEVEFLEVLRLALFAD